MFWDSRLGLDYTFLRLRWQLVFKDRHAVLASPLAQPPSPFRHHWLPVKVKGYSRTSNQLRPLCPMNQTHICQFQSKRDKNESKEGAMLSQWSRRCFCGTFPERSAACPGPGTAGRLVLSASVSSWPFAPKSSVSCCLATLGNKLLTLTLNC